MEVSVSYPLKNRCFWGGEERRTSSKIDSYGDYLFAISMGIYYEVSEYPWYVKKIPFWYNKLSCFPRTSETQVFTFLAVSGTLTELGNYTITTIGYCF